MTVLVVMGVSGSGKSTIARMLAARTGWAFAEGDDFHPRSNVDKMAHGHPLTDSDRWPWLAKVAAWIDAQIAVGAGGVVTCSALKRTYRDLLRRPEVVFVHLTADRSILAQRVADRHGHFMPAALLDSQLADLELPGPDELVITVDVSGMPSEIVDGIVDGFVSGFVSGASDGAVELPGARDDC